MNLIPELFKKCMSLEEMFGTSENNRVSALRDLRKARLDHTSLVLYLRTFQVNSRLNFFLVQQFILKISFMRKRGTEAML